MTYLVAIDLPAIAGTFACESAKNVLDLVKTVSIDGRVHILAPDGRAFSRAEFELMMTVENERAISRAKHLARLYQQIKKTRPIDGAAPAQSAAPRSASA
jgi:hypothetical protein